VGKTPDFAPLKILEYDNEFSSGCGHPRRGVFVLRGLSSGAKTLRSGLLARPSARLGRTAHLPRDLAPRDALCAQPPDLCGVHDLSRPSKALPLRAGVPQPGPDALDESA
jgi:hypothetical protein